MNCKQHLQNPSLLQVRSKFQFSILKPWLKRLLWIMLFSWGGEYYGGLEGESQFCWYRQTTGGLRTVIAGAAFNTYIVGDDDYTCSLVFGYTLVRSDGVVGELVLSDPSPLLYPEVPRIHKLVLKGQPVEGEMLTALEVIPRGDAQQRSSFSGTRTFSAVSTPRMLTPKS
jgi:hypothetical protein